MLSPPRRFNVSSNPSTPNSAQRIDMSSAGSTLTLGSSYSRHRSTVVKMALSAAFVAVCMYVIQSRNPTPVEFRTEEPGMTHVLVTGGAGYIGSHAVLRLLEDPRIRITVVDNLSRGNYGAIEILRTVADKDKFQFINADLGDPFAVNQVFSRNFFHVVMHFAAVAYVGESMAEPLRYYQNVTSNTLLLIRTMLSHNVKSLIYSSTCATYGEPERMPITEDTPQVPINPYGKSKKMAEDIIRDFAQTDSKFSATILRYFNVIGSDPRGRLGEAPRPELRHHGRISGACFDAALGLIDGLKILGTDYKTPDGTCIRDYIHVSDLVDAHVVAMQQQKEGNVVVFNVGTGKGNSVRQFVNACLKVTQRPIKVIEISERRPGDYAEVYSDPTKILKELGWKAKYTNLEETLEMAWRWREKHPNGYDV